MKKWLCVGLLAFLARSAAAFWSSVWVYCDYPWAYDSESGDWFWFNTGNSQWVANMDNGQWATLPNSAMASGWVFYQHPFAYAQDNDTWHWINAADTQWVVNMRTGVWSRFGQAPAPAGMVRIPGGTNAGTDPDFGAYSLTVNTFFMDRHEVTKALWDEVHAWALVNEYTFDNAGSGKAADHPVQTVNWYDAVKWCNARSEKAERTPAYYTDAAKTQTYKTGQVDDVFVKDESNGYRLPTDLQWEYAARGGASGHRFPWADSDEIQHARANYSSSDTQPYDTSPTRWSHPDYTIGDEPFTSPVGSFAANGYGVYDLAGNVAEWCFDWDPASLLTAFPSKIVRGGFWNHNASYCRVGYRYWDRMVYADDDFGFRTVVVPLPE